MSQLKWEWADAWRDKLTLIDEGGVGVTLIIEPSDGSQAQSVLLSAEEADGLRAALGVCSRRRRRR